MIPFIEKQSPEKIKRFQESKLQALFAYLKEKSPFYQSLFKREAVDIAQVWHLEDLANLPVTTKEDLQHFNSEFLCVDKRKIVDYVNTSGTSGLPVTFGLTNKDLDRLAYNEFLSLSCTGGSADELYQLTTTIDKRFMAGLAYFLGARKLGAGIIRVGSGVPEMQWDIIQKLEPTALIAVPSFIVKLLDHAQSNGIDYQSTSIKKIICIGENIRNLDFSLNTLGKRIHNLWKVDLYSTYASTEMGASFTECAAGKGGHHHPEIIITELLDELNQPVKDGEPGELTITTLGVEGMPLLRFKTGDICISHSGTCTCGRTTPRLSPVLGRKQQMIKYKGTTLYPQSIHDALNEVEFVKNYVVETYTNGIGTDEVLLHIGCGDITDSYKNYLHEHLRCKLRVSPSLSYKPVAEILKIQLPESSRKPITFIDKRINNYK